MNERIIKISLETSSGRDIYRKFSSHIDEQDLQEMVREMLEVLTTDEPLPF